MKVAFRMYFQHPEGFTSIKLVVFSVPERRPPQEGGGAEVRPA